MPSKTIRRKIPQFTPMKTALSLAALCLSSSLTTLTAQAHDVNIVKYLDQGLTEELRQTYYNMPQGSYLMPLTWYLALEQADNHHLFSRRSNIKKYKYLIDTKSQGNTTGLPLGFAIEPVENDVNGIGDWMGLTCAACHTNEIKYKGQRIRIDGAPSLANLSNFINDLYAAVMQTLNNEGKFSRFAHRVIGEYDPTATEALRTAFTNYSQNISAYLTRNQSDVEYGNGRVDAFGIIMNELFSDDLRVASNQSQPNAPINYPFLWGTPKHDWVQWNGSASNPLSRNVGEVLGTFGSVNLTDMTAFGKTSARGDNLIQLENVVAQLQSPQWPEEILGRINTEKAEKGRILYEEYRGNEPSCASCHSLKDANGNYPMTPAEENYFGEQFVITNMTPLDEIGTDPRSSLNFVSRVVSTGHIASILPAPFTGAPELPAPILLAILNSVATQNAINAIEPPLSTEETNAATGYRVKAEGLPPYRPKNLLAYRARPLAGVWATAPYLHNGSVQNLYELLQTSNERKIYFYVGSQKFNPVKVGFKSKKNRNTFKLDTRIAGNSNTGHEYGTNLSKKDKWALIEFLKTL